MHRRSRVLAGAFSPFVVRWGPRALAILALLAGVAAISGGVVPTPASAQIGGLTVTVSPSSQTIQAGGTASFTYSIGLPTTTPPFPTLTSVTASFSEGGSISLPATTSGSFSRNYPNPGNYSVTVSAVAVASNGTTTFTNADTAFINVSGSNQPLSLSLSASPQTAASGQVVTFTGTVISAPPNTTTTSASVNFGDGTSAPAQPTGAGLIATHTYGLAGTYFAVLTVNLSNGQSGSAQTTVLITGSAQPPQVSVTPLQASVTVGSQAFVNYSATAAPGIGFNSIQSMQIDWGDGTGSMSISPPSGQTSHIYNSTGTYTVRVTATDSSGAQGSNTTQISVSGANVPLSLSLSASPQTAPAGQSISFTGVVNSAPPNTTTTSATISFGDGTSAPAQATGAGLIAQKSYAAAGVYTATLTVNLSNGQSGQAQTTVTVTTPATTGQPPTNVQIVNAPVTGTVGQAVTFTAATARAVNTGASIASYTWSFGDGGTMNGISVSHVYSGPGVYTVRLTVTDTTGASASTSSTITISAATPPGLSISVSAGWNLLAGPANTVVSNNSGPLYTFQAGNTNYQVINNGAMLVAGQGYWAYFPSATNTTIPFTSPQTVTVQAPAGQFIMIGNPGNTSATVTGADIVYTYSASAGYQSTTTLQPGQGAWAFSYNGGAITITNAAQ